MPTIIILVFIFLFGLIIGSFLNCLIWRLHEKIPLTPFPPERRSRAGPPERLCRAGIKGGNIWKRSYCPRCRRQISWYDNLPVLSFVLLRGRCRNCGKAISWQYPAVELVTGLLFVVAFVINFQFSIFNFQTIFNSQFSMKMLRDWFLISIMIVVFIYDLRWYLILDIITLPACLIIFIFNILLGYSWQNLLFSGIIGSSFFLIQFIVSSGRWIGGGDIRLGLLMGLALGWPGVLIAIVISYFMGSIIGLSLIAAGKKQWGSEAPLGVFLSTGSIITLFWQEQILNWYFNIF